MPINPSKPSYGNPNQQYYRDEYTSGQNRIDNPSQYSRGDSHQGDPHYEGDNARTTMPGQADYLQETDRYKHVSGVLDFGTNHAIWKNEDNVINDTVLNKVAKKYNVDPKLVTVFVDRQNGKVKYDYRWFFQLKSAIKAEDEFVPHEVQYSVLEVGDIITLPRKWINTWPSIDEKLFREWNITTNDKWIVKKKDLLVLIRSKGAVALSFAKGQPYRDWLTYETKVQVVGHAGKEATKDFKSKLVKFSDIKDKEAFIFDRDKYPQALRERKLPYDTVFIKHGKGATSKDTKHVINEIAPDYTVYRAADVTQLRYVKDDIENALSRFFSKYRTKDTPYGLQVVAPLDDVREIFESADVPYAKFEQMTGISYTYRDAEGKEIKQDEYEKLKKAGKNPTKTKLSGKNQGTYKDYSWNIDDEKNEITITEAKK